MGYTSDSYIECGVDVCEARWPGGGKWAQIKAHSAGWYFQKNGTVSCPDHRPHYAPPWPKEKTDA